MDHVAISKLYKNAVQILTRISLFFAFKTLQLNIIRMLRQLEYFQEYQQKVSAMIGAENTKKLVSEALVLITVGGNDFVNNYFLVPFSARSRQYSLPDYVVFLVSEYKKLLMVIDTFHTCRESSYRTTFSNQFSAFSACDSEAAIIFPIGNQVKNRFMKYSKIEHWV